MEKSKLYTRSGDKGTTSLVGGQRVRKDSLRLDAYGTIDELSSNIGVVLSDPECDPKAREQLIQVQNELFNIGSYLATEITPESIEAPWFIGPPSSRAISSIEHWIDELDSLTPKVNAFVLPSGTLLASHTHVARTVCRRAERCILAFARTSEVAQSLIEYINRLSDYLFILARHFNHMAGIDEITWKPDK